jgi:hypothetical protein
LVWIALRWHDARAACSCCVLQWWSPWLLTSRFSRWCRGRRGQASCDAGEEVGWLQPAAGSPAAAAAAPRVRVGPLVPFPHCWGRHRRVMLASPSLEIWVPPVIG